MKTAKKLVPELRFPEFEGEWESNKLGDFASFAKGKNLSKNDICENGVNECIRYGELYTTYSETIDNVFSKTNLKLEDCIISEANDVIIPASGETQLDIATASCILKAGIIIGGDLNIVKTKKNGVFLSYYLNSKKKIDIAKLSQGSSVIHLYSKQLSLLKLNIPSLPEQQKIASFLTDVDAKITKLTKKKTLLTQYKKGVMQKIFNQELRFKDDNGNAFPKWEEKKLGDLTSLITKGTTPTSLGYSYLKEGVNFIKVECINNTGFIDVQSTPKVSQECNIALKRSELKVNDILFSIAGTLGRTALVKEKDLPANTNQALAIIRLKAGVNLNFINYSLNTSNIENYILKMVSVGAQPNLNLQQVSNIVIKLSCLEEQTKIANFLSDLDKKIEALHTKIENSKSFKKGLLQQLFV